MLTFSTWR